LKHRKTPSIILKHHVLAAENGALKVNLPPPILWRFFASSSRRTLIRRSWAKQYVRIRSAKGKYAFMMIVPNLLEIRAAPANCTAVVSGAPKRVVPNVLLNQPTSASGMTGVEGALKRVAQPLLMAPPSGASGMVVGKGALKSVARKVLKAPPTSVLNMEGAIGALKRVVTIVLLVQAASASATVEGGDALKRVVTIVHEDQATSASATEQGIGAVKRVAPMVLLAQAASATATVEGGDALKMVAPIVLNAQAASADRTVGVRVVPTVSVGSIHVALIVVRSTTAIARRVSSASFPTTNEAKRCTSTRRRFASEMPSTNTSTVLSMTNLSSRRTAIVR